MKELKVVMSIAGSDSGGGAGIQADLKTFQSLGVFGTTAITCITAQNPEGVSAVQEVPAEIVKKQIEMVMQYFHVKAVKTGMLFSKEIILAVSKVRRAQKFLLIVDPVMVATSGAKLLQDEAIETLRSELLPIADLITPNADEASLLLGRNLAFESMKEAAQELHSQFLVPVLLKGGHLPSNGKVKDVLFDGSEFYEYESKFIKEVNTHGTGCTYSSAIAAFLAKGQKLPIAIENARKYLQETISQSVLIGRGTSLNHNPELI